MYITPTSLSRLFALLENDNQNTKSKVKIKTNQKKKMIIKTNEKVQARGKIRV